jgi:hypothetical protein
MAAPTGNSNARKGKEWFDALRKECVQRGSLAKIASVLVDKAEAGEPWAIAEVANRFDGKPGNSVEVSGPDGEPLTVTWLK